MGYGTHKVRCWLAGGLGLVVGTAAWAASVAATPGAGNDARGVELARIVQQRLRVYNRVFPRLQFLHLHGGQGWQRDMETLVRHLGRGAVNLDYEHPPDLRTELLRAAHGIRPQPDAYSRPVAAQQRSESLHPRGPAPRLEP